MDMAKIVFSDEVKSMIGQQVKAVGCCGMKDGVIVFGVLESYDNGHAIVKVSDIPVLVNKNTLELSYGNEM